MFSEFEKGLKEDSFSGSPEGEVKSDDTSDVWGSIS
jgi:hypothetical protein